MVGALQVDVSAYRQLVLDILKKRGLDIEQSIIEEQVITAAYSYTKSYNKEVSTSNVYTS